MTGESEMIEKPYEDPRFDPTFDQQSGFKTENMLCCPIKDFHTGDVYGVIQAINKKGKSKFGKNDRYLLESLGTQAVITLQHSLVYEIAMQEQQRTSALIYLMQSIKRHDNLGSLLFTITQRALEIVGMYCFHFIVFFLFYGFVCPTNTKKTTHFICCIDAHIHINIYRSCKVYILFRGSHS